MVKPEPPRSIWKLLNLNIMNNKTSHNSRERFCLVSLFAVCFLMPSITFAQVYISEIMYDLEGSDTNEWIEIHNLGSDSVDMAPWKFFESNSNHGLNLIQGDGVLLPQSFAIIADDAVEFQGKYPQFKGLLFDSSFSLSNTGETLALRDGNLVDKDTVSYSSELGANGDGASLQKNNGSFSPNTPSPGGSNVSATNFQSSSQSTSQGSVNTTPSGSAVSQGTPKGSGAVFAVSIGKDRTVAVANPVMFRAEVKNKSVYDRTPSFSWSMGDGSLKNGEVIEYQYRYPGDYTVVLNASRGQEEATSQVHVKVIEPNFNIEVRPDGAIFIENKNGEDINLFKWSLESLGKRFDFPQDTIIKAKSGVTIPPNVHGLIVSQGFLKFKNPFGFEYIPLANSTPINRMKATAQKPTIKVLAQEVEVANETAPPTEDISQISNSDDQKINVPEAKEQKQALTASVGSAFEIEKPKGFWRGVFSFFRGLFD